MRCPTCGQPAELLKNPCCESAWAYDVVARPTEAVAALQRGDYDGAVRLASEQLAVAFAVVTAAKLLRGDQDLPIDDDRVPVPPGSDWQGMTGRLVDRLRASVGRTAGAAVSRDEQHTLEHLLTLRLSWPERLRVLWRGRLDIVAAVRTERLAGSAAWACRVVE